MSLRIKQWEVYKKQSIRKKWVSLGKRKLYKKEISIRHGLAINGNKTNEWYGITIMVGERIVK